MPKTLHPIERLTTGEYNAIMTAINNYRQELESDGLSCYPDMILDGQTAEKILKDLNQVEEIIINANIPL